MSMTSDRAPQPTVREIALGWNTDNDPSEVEYNATETWLRLSRGRPTVSPAQMDKLQELVRRFKAAHPDVYPNT